MDPTSTTVLLERIRGGDAAARDQLVARYLGPLRRFARGRTPSHLRPLTETDDLVQITLLAALDRMEGFEPKRPGAFLAYLRRILINRIRDQIRAAARRPAPGSLGQDVEAPGPTPLEQAIGRETIDSWEAAVARLPEEQQEAVMLRIEMGLTYGEVAEAIGSPSANAARMTIARALVRLSEAMHG